MQLDPLKTELMEWIQQLADKDLLHLLKSVKDARNQSDDWWNELSLTQQQSLLNGLADLDANRVVSHADVSNRYGL